MAKSIEVAANTVEECILCQCAGGRVVWSDPDWRVVGVDDTDFPLFYRVVARAHVEEFSMLTAAQRVRCMDLVCAVEVALLEHEQPNSINLAALGNLVHHLHWHVIARFEWDSHFPEPVWGRRQRCVVPAARDRRRRTEADLDEIVRAALDDVSEPRGA